MEIRFGEAGKEDALNESRTQFLRSEQLRVTLRASLKGVCRGKEQKREECLLRRMDD